MLALRELEGFVLRELERFILSRAEGLALRKIEGFTLSKGEGFALGFLLVSIPPPSAQILKTPKSNHSRTYTRFSRNSNYSHTCVYPGGRGTFQSHFPTAPATLLFPLHTRTPPATPFFPLLTQKQGGIPGRSEVRPLHGRRGIEEARNREIENCLGGSTSMLG